MTGLSVPSGLLPSAGGGRTFPLSYQQEWMCVAATFHRAVIDDAGYCIHLVVRIDGDINLGCLQAALDDVVARHSALRTRFAVTAGGLAVQEEVCEARREIVVRDAAGMRAEDVLATLREPAAPFGDPPALRVELVRIADDDAFLGIAVHHLACDATGLHLLIRDLARGYTARLVGDRLPPLEIGYGEIAAQQRATKACRLDDDLAWWRRFVDGYTPVPLRLDRPFGAGIAASNVVVRSRLADVDGLRAWQRFALRRRSSLFVTLLAVAETMMGARRDGDDRVVLTFLDQRDHPAARDMVGFFLSPTAVRFALPSDVPLRQSLGALTRAVLDVSERAYVPTHLLIGAAPALLGSVLGMTPPAAVFLQHQARPMPAAISFGDARGSVVATGVRGPSEPGLTLKALPMVDGTLDLEIGYEARHFDDASARTLLAHTGDVVRAMVDCDGERSPRELLSQVGGW